MTETAQTIVTTGCVGSMTDTARAATGTISGKFRFICGSVAAKDELLRRTVIRELSARLPRLEIVTRNAIPILGAVLDALAEGGVELGPAEQDQLLRWKHGL